jgi:YD repeat-containing protein
MRDASIAVVLLVLRWFSRRRMCSSMRGICNSDACKSAVYSGCKMQLVVRVFAFSLFLGGALAAFPQNPYIPDAGKVGLPINGVFSGGSIDSVQVNNGNLHIDIPLLHLPGIGMDTDVHFVYDNQVFTLTQVPYTFGPSGPPTSYWDLITMSRYLASVNDPLSGMFKMGEHNEQWECGNPPSSLQNATYIEYVMFSDPGGTSHSFPAQGYTQATDINCVPFNQMPLGSFSNDAQGVYLTEDSSGNVTSMVDKHGTRYTLGANQGNGIVSAQAQNPNQPANPIIGATSLNFYPVSTIEDSNGNKITSNGNGVVDTVNRTITETAGPSFAPNNSLMVEASGKQISKISYYDQTNHLQSITINYGPVLINLVDACNGNSSALCGPQVGTQASTVTVQLPTSIVLQNGVDEYRIDYFPNQLGEVQDIILPTGGEISYTYSSPGALNGTIARRVVARTVTENGQSSTWQFNGYTVTDPYSNDTVYTCGLGWPCYMTSETLYNGSYSSGTKLVTRIPTYTQYGCAQLETSEKLTWSESNQTTETDTGYDSVSTPQQFCQSFNTWSSVGSRGNPISKIAYDYGSSGNHGNLLSNTQFSYWHDTHSNYASANIADRVAQVSVYNSATMNSSTLMAQTTTAYDQFNESSVNGQGALASTSGTTQHDYTNYGASSVLRGLPTSVTKYTGPSSSSITNYVNYNDLGNPTVTTDGRGYSTTLTYGSQNAFVTSTTMPSTTTNGTSVPHAVPRYQDVSTGLLMWKGTQNSTPSVGQPTPSSDATVYAYDPRMRVLTETRPDGGSTTNSYPDPNHVTSTVVEDSSGRSSTTTVTMDGLGRKVTTASTSDNLCGPLTVDTGYDLLGRVAWVSNPHCGSTQVTDGYSSYSYDAISRLINKQNPDGSLQSWSPSGSIIDFFDETSRHWQHTYDAAGRLIQVREPNGSTTISSSRQPYTGTSPILETEYTYDALGNLTQVDQWGGTYGASGDHIRKFAYDGMSRLVGSNNPESASSPHPAAQTCSGAPSGSLWTTCYVYDGNGNLTHKTDNRGISINYSYDALNRLLGKTYTDSTPSVAFSYDLSTISGHSYDVGQMTQATVTSGSTVLAQANSYAFDPMGRPQNEQQCTPATNCGSAPYQLAYTYDYAGKLTSAKFPSNVGSNGQALLLNLSYDPAERLLTAASNWTGDSKHPPTLFQAPPPASSFPAYGPMGLSNAALGFNSSSGTTTATEQRGYDDRGRVVNSVYAAGGSGITDSRASGSITISGSEGQVTKTATVSSIILNDPTAGLTYGSQPYTCWYGGIPPTQFNSTSYFTGNVSVTVQAPTPFSGTGSWGTSDENQADVRSAIVSGLNAAGSPVAATLNANNTITLTSKASGISANYPVTISQTQGQTQISPSPPSGCN